MNNYLGIDTSNYRSSAALFGEVAAHNREFLPVKEGELGLRQSDAVFLQTKLLPEIIEKLFCSNRIQTSSIKAIGVSSKPRDHIDSYMPCFLVGEGCAKSIASVLNIPLFKFSHQAGHIVSALYSADALKLVQNKFIAFHVSGGTTEALLFSPNENIFTVKIIAKSQDLHAGQLIDRVGKKLNLAFPSGPYLEELALKHEKINNIKPTLKGLDCCFSGIENKAEELLKKQNNLYVARYVIDYIAQTLKLMTEKILLEYGELPIVYSGGVMANSIIKDLLSSNFDSKFASKEFSGDNAMGIAILAALKNGEIL